MEDPFGTKYTFGSLGCYVLCYSMPQILNKRIKKHVRRDLVMCRTSGNAFRSLEISRSINNHGVWDYSHVMVDSIEGHYF